MAEPVWQSNYVDMCGPDAIRFGVECSICGARYVTPAETIAPELIASAIPGSVLEREIADLKYQRFTEFDAAFRELSITCFRCGRVACPDCWDDDNRMCAECVLARGLIRSSRIGPPGQAPLRDGRLIRQTAGKHSDIGQPEWLGRLLAAETPHASDLPTALLSGWPSSMPPVPGVAARVSAAPAPALPFELAGSSAVSAPPVEPIHTPVPAPLAGGEPVDWSAGLMGLDDGTPFRTTEGSATSSMVTCPRCGTANYDFVSRCTVCQLQLIQICAACEKLNAGHAQECEFCGAPLTRPSGWSGVHATIQHVSPDGVSRQRRSGPLAGTRATPPRLATTGAPTLDAAAFAAPATPAYGPFQTPKPQQPRAHRSWYALDIAVSGTQGLAKLAVVAAILAVIGAIIAAEVSSQANTFIAGLIHIDIRTLLAPFVQQVQRIVQHNH